mmetsp:Transcript_9637/g.10989  ORF Transcript_9637/g.10989 Transcript_9637/m.10989 type:complete len:540 (-) Transcript_9637:427-2046(-)|eukprot:CAMPEP_0194165008 /NCGR_PEP_ID=MMETSP0154-20130528/1049_1 /TAXON_ID=1049557 /ORGANISM="Thalassiothrix antarctica, Strain L6-D1" /LENGTH=539 /DNA_ID=CAMNT_0038875353 /DNA_START=58 /DNA_END=1677 /DNA_ORIENTATION=+
MEFQLPLDRYNILVEFAVKHMDFQNAELESVLDLFGIKLSSPDCQILTLPTSTERARPFLVLSFPHNLKGKRFRLQDGKCDDQSQDQDQIPFSNIISRCILVRSVIELWGVGKTLSDCVACSKKWNESSIGKEIFEKNSGIDKSWKITIHTLGTKYTRLEQDNMRLRFRFFDFKGQVKMEDPTNEFIMIREAEIDVLGNVVHPQQDCNKKIIQENVARPPIGVYFGRILGQGRLVKGRGAMEQYSLKRRAYLGPTSMDAELSFIMTNFGQVEKGKCVIDPFVGTGSILLSCAIRGAYCSGTDIDIRVLRGRSEHENIRSNFLQFGLPRPELVRSDNAIYHRHYQRSEVPLYDAIVTDPPYGIRAGARKTGSKLETPKPVVEELRHNHIAQTKPYSVADVMADLLDMAARTLVMGGRLVYVIPSFSINFSIEDDLPQHTCLELIHCCYQSFTSELGRRIVTMKKVGDYEETHQEEYLSAVWKNGAESAEKCANIRDKLLEAAKKKPGYQQKAAIRKEKRRKSREAKKLSKRKFATLDQKG